MKSILNLASVVCSIIAAILSIITIVYILKNWCADSKEAGE